MALFSFFLFFSIPAQADALDGHWEPRDQHCETTADSYPGFYVYGSRNDIVFNGSKLDVYVTYPDGCTLEAHKQLYYTDASTVIIDDGSSQLGHGCQPEGKVAHPQPGTYTYSLDNAGTNLTLSAVNSPYCPGTYSITFQKNQGDLQP
jgi:hypothetical protein